MFQEPGEQSSVGVVVRHACEGAMSRASLADGAPRRGAEADSRASLRDPAQQTISNG